MTRSAVLHSQVAAAVLLPFVLPVLSLLFLVVLVLQGRPFLYSSERMRDANTSFRLYKIRTMRPDDDNRETILGGPNRRRVTSVGWVLRKTRLDELPQIFNVLKGDIGFIGPRPPLREHVLAYPAHFGRVLSATRPGITGLSTVMVHAREDRLLSRCSTVEEAEEVYRKHCLPLKLRLDLLYAEKSGVALDLLILWRTFSRLIIKPVPATTRVQRRVVAADLSADEKLPLAA